MATRAIHVVLAVVLLLAASLKAQSMLLLEQPTITEPALFARWLLVLVEWMLAFWLLTGIAARLASRVTIGLLLVFMSVSIWSLIRRQTDCGCFGAHSVHPGWMLGFNVIAFAVLLWQYRREERLHSPKSEEIVGPRIAFAIVLSIALPVGILGGEILRRFMDWKNRIDQ